MKGLQISKTNRFAPRHIHDVGAVESLIAHVNNGLAIAAHKNPHVGTKILDPSDRRLFEAEELAEENILHGQLLNASAQQVAYVKQAAAVAREEETMLARQKAKARAAIEASDDGLAAIRMHMQILQEDIDGEASPRPVGTSMQESTPAQGLARAAPAADGPPAQDSSSDGSGDATPYEPFEPSAFSLPRLTNKRASRIKMAELFGKRSTLKFQKQEAELALEEYEAYDEDHPSSSYTSKMMNLAKTFPLARPTPKEFADTVYVHTHNVVYSILKEVIDPVLWQDWMDVYEGRSPCIQSNKFLERLFATCHDVSIAHVQGEVKKLYKLTAAGLPADLTPAGVLDYMQNRRMRIETMGGAVYRIPNTQLIAMTCDLLTEAFGDVIRGPIANYWLRPISSAYGSTRGKINDAPDADMLKFRETLSVFSHLKTRAPPRKNEAAAKETSAKPAPSTGGSAGTQSVSVAAGGAAANENGGRDKQRSRRRNQDQDSKKEHLGTGKPASAGESAKTVSVGTVPGGTDDGWRFVRNSRARNIPAQQPKQPKHVSCSDGLFVILDVEECDLPSDSEASEPSTPEPAPASTRTFDVNVLAGAGTGASPEPTQRASPKPTQRASVPKPKASPPERDSRRSAAPKAARKADSTPKTTTEAKLSGATMVKLDSAADVSVHGNDAPVTDVTPEHVAIQPLGPKGQKIQATSYGNLRGVLTCAVTGRHLSLRMGGYGGTGNESTIWSTRDINAVGGWVTFGPDGVQYIHLPGRGRFYMTTDGHAIVAHPKPGESPSSAAKRARKAVVDAGWKPSRVPKRHPGPRAPRQRQQGTPAGQGEGATPRC